jgi:hypothetical protein
VFLQHGCNMRSASVRARGSTPVLLPTCNLHLRRGIIWVFLKPPPRPMPIHAPRPEFRELAPWPAGLRFLDGPVERIKQNRLPPRPDSRSYAGSSAGLTADSAFAEPGVGDLTAERLAQDAERQRRKRATARA